MKKLFYILISISIIIFSCKKASVTESTTIEPGIDTTPPIITLKGLANYTFTLDGYEDPGVTATDDRDGDISNKVEVTGTIIGSVTGTYKLEYNVIDAAGNKAEKKSRTFLIKNSADYLVGNYSTTCTCRQYTIGLPAPTIYSSETFTTSVSTSSVANNYILFSSTPFAMLVVKSLTVVDPFNAYGPRGTISNEGKVISVKTYNNPYNYTGTSQKECDYLFIRY